MKNPGQKYIVVKGSGGAGLGDKIFALIVAGMYSLVSGRILYVDWRDRTYGDATRNYFPDLLRAVGLAVTDQLPTAGRAVPKSWDGRL